MAFIEWSDVFLLGVRQFDEHHRHLVELLNRLYDDYTSEAPSETVGIILDELTDYAAYHFAAEENWMEQQSYFKLTEHHREHECFSKKVVDLQEDFHAGKLNLSLELLVFLRDWLSDHILKTDAEYGHYIAAKGVTISLV